MKSQRRRRRPAPLFDSENAGKAILTQRRQDAGTPGIPKQKMGFRPSLFLFSCVSAAWRHCVKFFAHFLRPDRGSMGGRPGRENRRRISPGAGSIFASSAKSVGKFRYGERGKTNTRQVRAFMRIAIRAGESQVFLHIFTPMLPGADVFDVKPEKCCCGLR